MTPKRANPYVGPRSFEMNETLYGRSRELRLLSAQLISERVVLLHSPSGAGKTSLIQAGLVPLLREEKFHILPVARVNLEPDAEVSLTPGFNRYVYSAIAALEEGLPQEQRRPLSALANLTLDAYLTERPRPADAPRSDLLLFDQFEEILTIAPTDREGKQAFFAQLGAALRNSTRWALFAMREDYLGAIAPYVRPLPNRFEATFRLDLLGLDAALQAIQSPARGADVDFSDEAAHKLVDDLRRVQVQLPDGSLESVLGQYIEPVQLQVVCYRLWQGLTPGDKDIDETDLARVGDVDQSLAEYYATSVKNIAEKSGMGERRIREWFDRKLITPDGIRGQVLKGQHHTDDLPNFIINMLENTHLVRGDTRSGKTWYELSHDRLLKPIHENNEAWFEKNLSLLQRQADLWNRQGRPEQLLLRGKLLDEALEGSGAIMLTPEERDFLQFCQTLRDHEQLEQNELVQKRRNLQLSILVSVAIVALIVIAFFARQAQNAALAAEIARAAAVQAQEEAEAASIQAMAQKSIADQLRVEAQEAHARAIASQLSIRAQSIYDYRSANQLQAALLDIQSLRLAGNNEATSFLLNNNFAALPIASSRLGNSVNSVGTSPDGQYVFSAGCHEDIVQNNRNICTTGLIQVWEAASGEEIAKISLEGSVIEAVFSPNGKFIASGGDDKTVRVWETTTGKQVVSQLTGGTVLAVAFSPNSMQLAVGSDDSTIRVMEIMTGKELAFFWLEGGIRDVAYSPDGRYLVSASNDKSVRIFDIDAKAEVLRMSHEGGTRSAVFSPDGLYVASGGADGVVRIWQASDGQEIVRLLHGLNVNVVAFSPDGTQVISAGCEKLGRKNTCAEGSTRLWDVFTQKEICHLTQDGDVLSANFSPDGKYIVSASTDGTARVWNTASGHEVSRMTHDASVNFATFSPDGSYVVSGASDGLARTWVATSQKHMIDMAHAEIYVWDVAFSPDGKYIVSGGEDDTARVWNTATGQEIARMVHAGDVRVVTYRADGQYVVSGSEDGTARVWDPITGKEIVHMVHEGQVWAAAFSPDGKYLITGTDDKIAKVWEAATGNEIARFDLDGGIRAASFSPDGKLAVTGSSDNTVRIWEIASGKEILRMIHEGGIETAAFSPDGNYVISGAYDEYARLWDIRTGKQVLQIRHNGAVLSTSFSPDGKFIITGSDDKFARIWTADTGSEVARLYQDENTIFTLFVSFSADGRLAFSGSDGGVARIWQWRSADLIQSACNVMPRNLTRAEWQEYIGAFMPYQAVCPNLPIEP